MDIALNPLIMNPAELPAAQYMWRHVEAEIAEYDEIELGPEPSPELMTLLLTRYGPGASGARRQKQDRWLQAAERAVVESTKASQQAFVGMAIWDEEKAIMWFKRRLERLWPKQGNINFLAEDVLTLWTACAAMEFARRRNPEPGNAFPAVPALITGPTGTGKELLATAIHQCFRELHPQYKPAFAALNCGGLSRELLESELFGHEKGAFTGATRRKEGFLQTHANGTVFLDEIGDVPKEVQVKLLRFLNSGECRRVGSNSVYHTWPHIIAATNIDLDQSPDFRRDLYHRLNGRQFRLTGLAQRSPSSRSRLLRSLYSQLGFDSSKPAPVLTSEAWRALQDYSWPGNLRQAHYVFRELIDEDHRGNVLGIDALPGEISRWYNEVVSPAERAVLYALARREAGESDERVVQHFVLSALSHGLQRQCLAHQSPVFAALTEALGLSDIARSHKQWLDARFHLEKTLLWSKKLIPELQAALCSIGSSDPKLLEGLSQLEGIVRANEHTAQAAAQEASATIQVVSKESAASALVHGLAMMNADPQLSVLAQKLAPAVLALLGLPPVAEAVRGGITKLREITVGQAWAKLRNRLRKTDGQSEDWDAIKNDPRLLTAALHRHGGNKAALARACEISAETVRRRCKDLKTTSAGNRKPTRGGRRRRKVRTR